MEDKMIKQEEEIGEGTITFKNGQKKKVPIKTVYKHYESGRKDCTVQVHGF